MKTKFKLSAIMLSIAISSGMAQAQTEGKAVISAPEKIKEGNSFEREMTPLLREISKRKSQLELRKIERELAKIDEDEIKVQLEIEEKNKKNAQPANANGMGGDGSISFGGMQGGPMSGLMIPGQAPMGLPGMPGMQMPGMPNGQPNANGIVPGQSANVNGIPGIPQVPVPTEKKEEKKTKTKKSKDTKDTKETKEPVEEVVAEEDLPPLVEVKVLMIYGFDGNLSAKIAAGGQGGYVVQKGDVMPDGRTVTEINPNFIEVKDVKNKLAKGSSRIFVTSGEVAGSDSGNDNKNKFGDKPSSGGSQDSSNAGLPSNIQANPNSSVKDNKGFSQLSPKDQEALSATEAIMKSFNTGVTQSNKTLK